LYSGSYVTHEYIGPAAQFGMNFFPVGWAVKPIVGTLDRKVREYNDAKGGKKRDEIKSMDDDYNEAMGAMGNMVDNPGKNPFQSSADGGGKMPADIKGGIKGLITSAIKNQIKRDMQQRTNRGATIPADQTVPEWHTGGGGGLGPLQDSSGMNM